MGNARHGNRGDLTRDSTNAFKNDRFCCRDCVDQERAHKTQGRLTRSVMRLFATEAMKPKISRAFGAEKLVRAARHPISDDKRRKLVAECLRRQRASVTSRKILLLSHK